MNYAKISECRVCGAPIWVHTAHTSFDPPITSFACNCFDSKVRATESKPLGTTDKGKEIKQIVIRLFSWTISVRLDHDEQGKQ